MNLKNEEKNTAQCLVIVNHPYLNSIGSAIFCCAYCVDRYVNEMLHNCSLICIMSVIHSQKFPFPADVLDLQSRGPKLTRMGGPFQRFLQLSFKTPLLTQLTVVETSQRF